MIEYAVPRTGQGSLFIEKVGKCRKNGERVFIEEKASDGSTVNSFARRVGVNPVTGRISVVVAVLSISEPDEGTTYASIARALAADFYNLYYVDLASGDFIKYSSSVGGTGIAVERRGKSFFEAARIEALTRIYRDDQERFLNRFTKEKILGSLDESGVFNITYRQMDSGTPCYVRMKITRMEDDADHIIIGISIIESEMKRREVEDRLRQERVLLERIAALSASYIVLYTIVILELCHISKPFLVRCVSMKIPVQIVLCDMYRIIAVPSATLRLPLNRRLDMLFSADSKDPLIIDIDIVMPFQFVPYSAISHIRMSLMDGLDFFCNLLVPLLAITDRIFQPTVISSP